MQLFSNTAPANGLNGENEREEEYKGKWVRSLLVRTGMSRSLC